MGPDDKTLTTPGGHSPPPALDEGRFPPGTILAQRYRIVNLLGRGGMGEVYRANDLLIGQPVALKFLPEAWTQNETVVARFRNEVRTARLVTHPNVCRVYDLGEADGRIFLSMEWIDGEDLRSLLKRIGRLPEDKALEAARKLCAGLQAAHDKQVLHRDLKPANIMLDGRGEVLITDFGLASVGEVNDITSGTPAYMAPEQREGREVTPRSDIYSLGLVLHELFTGRLPVDARSTSANVDPAILAVVRRCLDPDPAQRPASPMAVARALPGGDPLAAALAAGETPSPDVVAGAGERLGLAPAPALALLALAVSGPLLAAWWFDRASPASPANPDELRVRARDLIHQTEGRVEPYEASGIRSGWVPPVPRGAARLLSADRFWLRSAPVALGVFRLSTLPQIEERNPPVDQEGMALVAFDIVTGKLIHYESVPRMDRPASERPVDWSAYLRRAALDATKLEKQFESADAIRWRYTDAAGLHYTVEGATQSGHLRLFRVRGEWEREQIPSQWLWRIETLLVVLAGCFAWRNHRAGRVDWEGALAFAKVVAIVLLVAQFLRGSDLLHWNRVTPLDSVISAIGVAAVMACMYAAIEPHMRRRWPQFVVTWLRLLRGGWRDPTVGRDVLAGLGGMSSAVLVLLVLDAAAGGLGALDQVPLSYTGSTPMFLAVFPGIAMVGMTRAITSSLVFFLLRTLLRNNGLAAIAWVLFFTAMLRGEFGTWSPLLIAGFAFMGSVQAWLLLRFGFLSKAAGEIAFLILALTRTLDPSRWYSAYSFLALLAFTALAAGAYWNATAASRAETSRS